jgi:putative hydrolase of the HAD superfamily
MREKLRLNKTRKFLIFLIGGVFLLASLDVYYLIWEGSNAALAFGGNGFYCLRARAFFDRETDQDPTLPIKALIFDMDGTLYFLSPELQREITDANCRVLAHKRGVSQDEAERILEERKRELGSPSSSETWRSLGYDIKEVWREIDKIDCSKYVKRDNRVVRFVTALSSQYRLIVVTNGHDTWAEKVMQLLGLSDVFERVITQEELGIGKPNPRPFQAALEYLQLNPEEVVLIGDRLDMDIEPAQKLGIRGIQAVGPDNLIATLEDRLKWCNIEESIRINPKDRMDILERALNIPSAFIQWKALSWFASIDAASLSSENLRRAKEMLVHWKRARAEIKRERTELLDRIFNIYHHREFGVFSKIEGQPISFEAEMITSSDYAKGYPQRRTQAIEADRRQNPWLVDGLTWPDGKEYKSDLGSDVRSAFTTLSYYNAFSAHGMQDSMEGFMNVILEGNIRGYPFDDFGNLIEENRVATGRFDSFDYNRGTEDNPLSYGPGIVVLAKTGDYRDHIAYLIPSRDLKEVIIEGLIEARDKGIIDEAGYRLRCAKLMTYDEYADWYVQNVSQELRRQPEVNVAADATFVDFSLKIKTLGQLAMPLYATEKGNVVTAPAPLGDVIDRSGGMAKFLEIVKDAIRHRYKDPGRYVGDEEIIEYLMLHNLVWSQIEEDASDIRQARGALRKIDALPPDTPITDELIQGFTFNWQGDTFYIVRKVLELRQARLHQEILGQI